MKKKDLNNKTNKSLMRITCWHCHLNGCNILDKFGCCNRCGTNLKKWSSQKNLPYPDLSDAKITQEVLGNRESFKIPVILDKPEDSPVKYNPLQQTIHRGNETYRVDPKCHKCSKVATYELTRTNKNGSKIYVCDDCYDLSIEWEITPANEVNYQALYINRIETYWRKRQENETRNI